MSTSTPSNDPAETTNGPPVPPPAPAVSMPFNERFSGEVAYVRGVATDAGNVWISSANLYLVSLAILAECECLGLSGKVRENELLKGYNKVLSKTEVDGATKHYEVSIRKIAKEVVDLYDTYEFSEFLECTMLRNWRWTSTVKEGQFDPYAFSRGELQVRLCDAGMGLLVKGLRLYLMETVKHFFIGVRDEKDWGKVSHASYKIGDTVRSSGDFTYYVEAMMRLYDHIDCLSPSLDEIKDVVARASEAGRKEYLEKREHAPRTFDDSKRSVHFSKKSGGGKFVEREERTVTTYYEPTPRETHYKPSEPTQAVENKWARGNPLVKSKVVVEKVETDKNTDKNVTEEKEKDETVKATEESNNSRTKKVDSMPPRRVVRSGKPTKKQDDEEGWTVVRQKAKTNTRH